MIEREIIIGLITSTEFIQQTQGKCNFHLLESQTAKRMASWCMDYYDKYKKAPGRNIETIFYSKIKDPKFPKDLAEEIEDDILPSLSKEYEENGINLDYLVEETLKHFQKCQMLKFSDAIRGLAEAEKLDEALELLSTFEPIEQSTSDKLSKFIMNLDEMRNSKVEIPKAFMKPWLRSGQITFIYGDYGTGKSMLALHIASLLALNKNDALDHDIGEWLPETPTGCLYVDGEMGLIDFRERLSQFEYLGKSEFPVKAFTLPEYQLATEDDFTLNKRENQMQVIHWLQKNPNYKLLILDSVTTLFGLTDENNNGEWNNKINPFLRDLRALGVAVIILHHSGKDGNKGLRGASAMGAMAHNIFYIENHEKDTDEGEASFTITKKKQRSGGYQFKNFSIHYFQNSEYTNTEWETGEGISKNDEGLTDKQIRIIKYLVRGNETQKQISERIGCNQSNVAQTKRKAIQLHYLDENGKPTQLWKQLITDSINRNEE